MIRLEQRCVSFIQLSHPIASSNAFLSPTNNTPAFSKDSCRLFRFRVIPELLTYTRLKMSAFVRRRKADRFGSPHRLRNSSENWRKCQEIRATGRVTAKKADRFGSSPLSDENFSKWRKTCKLSLYVRSSGLTAILLDWGFRQYGVKRSNSGQELVLV